MENKIFLIRHGQDTDNATGILNGRRNTSLTDLGKTQAKAAAFKLKPKNIQTIYSSPLKRAYQTAEIIARQLDINKIIKLNDLRERDFGVLTGKPKTDIPKYAKIIIAGEKVNYFLQVPNAETFPQLFKRAKTVLKKIKTNQPMGNILIVTHGDLGKMIRAVFYGWSWEEELTKPYFHNGDVIELK